MLKSLAQIYKFIDGWVTTFVMWSFSHYKAFRINQAINNSNKSFAILYLQFQLLYEDCKQKKEFFLEMKNSDTPSFTPEDYKHIDEALAEIDKEIQTLPSRLAGIKSSHDLLQQAIQTPTEELPYFSE